MAKYRVLIKPSAPKEIEAADQKNATSSGFSPMPLRTEKPSTLPSASTFSMT